MSGLKLRRQHTREMRLCRFCGGCVHRKNPPEVVKEIREAFAQLSPDDAKKHYTVEPADDDFYFSWPMYAVKARRR